MVVQSLKDVRLAMLISLVEESRKLIKGIGMFGDIRLAMNISELYKAMRSNGCNCSVKRLDTARHNLLANGYAIQIQERKVQKILPTPRGLLKYQDGAGNMLEKFFGVDFNVLVDKQYQRYYENIMN